MGAARGEIFVSVGAGAAVGTKKMVWFLMDEGIGTGKRANGNAV